MRNAILIIIASLGLLVGCQSSPEATATPKTGESARITGTHIAAATVAVKAAAAETVKLPDSQTKGAIAANLTTATTELTAGAKSADVTAANAEKDASTIAAIVADNQKLKANDPVRKGLQWFAFGAIAIGVILIVLHYAWLKLPWSDDAGGACIAVGVITWTILAFERPIMFAVIVCLIGYAAYKVWHEWRDARKEASAKLV